MSGRSKLKKTKFYLGRRSKKVGRKVRNLENGKWYTSKREAASARVRSAAAKARVDPDLMMKATRANSTKAAIARREASRKKYFQNYPEFLEHIINRMQEPMRLKLYGRDGKLLLRVVHAEREKTQGVHVGVQIGVDTY